MFAKPSLCYSEDLWREDPGWISDLALLLRSVSMVPGPWKTSTVLWIPSRPSLGWHFPALRCSAPR